MRDMKYLFNEETGHFVLIPDTGMAHNDVGGHWTNAGFVSFSFDNRDECGNIVVKAHCYGKSVSTGLSCGEKDEIYINYALKNWS